LHKRSNRTNHRCLLGLLLLAASGAGATTLSLGSHLDSQTVAIQRKADGLYEEGEFDRAFFIYRNELAPLGDKYAQYMVGYMRLTGTGVEADPILASAWYRLAAERGQPEFEEVRDDLLRRLSEPDLLRSDAAYSKLRWQYSDLVLLLDLVKSDLELLGPRTGSRLAGSSSQVATLDPRTGSMVTADQVRSRARERLEQRLRAIGRLLGMNIETDAERVDLAELERLVEREVETLSDR
jgi:hypothetical protein